MTLLSQGGQLEKIESKVARPKIGVDFLAQIRDDDDKKQMEE